MKRFPFGFKRPMLPAESLKLTTGDICAPDSTDYCITHVTADHQSLQYTRVYFEPIADNSTAFAQISWFFNLKCEYSSSSSFSITSLSSLLSPSRPVFFIFKLYAINSLFYPPFVWPLFRILRFRRSFSSLYTTVPLLSFALPVSVSMSSLVLISYIVYLSFQVSLSNSLLFIYVCIYIIYICWVLFLFFASVILMAFTYRWRK